MLITREDMGIVSWNQSSSVDGTASANGRNNAAQVIVANGKHRNESASVWKKLYTFTPVKRDVHILWHFRPYC